MRRILVSILALAASLAPAAIAAPPTVPTSLPYQGLLLDGLGAPRTGSVDLTLRVWDGVVGGTLVYKQSFPNVGLVDGVFTVQLGPTGEGTDAPSNPLTTDLATALSGDAGPTAPVRFLEVTVGGDGALARTQILASAYAVRAASAASADAAANATNVAGVSGQFVSEFFEHFPADGGEPANYDVREGVGDVDGDGVLNFMDADNDGDSIVDGVELNQGSDMNLVTPIVTTATPPSGLYTQATLVTVNGSNFQPPLAVSFGTQSPAASNVTPTSFQVTVGPQNPGSVAVSVANANGQGSVPVTAFTFAHTLPHTVLLNPGANNLQSSLDVRTGTSFVVYSGQKQYGVGQIASGLTVNSLSSRGGGGQIATAFDASGRLAGVRCDPSGTNCDLELLVDADNDGQLEDQTATLIETVTGSNAILFSATLDFDPSGRPVVGYQRSDGSIHEAAVAHDRNGDGDFADANERVALSTFVSSAFASGLAVDSAGRVAYVRGTSGVRVAWDRNGDGDYDDTVGANPEQIALATGFTPSCVGAAFDASDRLVVVNSGGSGNVVLSRDLNADGDFVDIGEATNLGTATFCDVDARAGQPLSVAFASGSAPTTIQLRIDVNDDGDFADAGESSSFSAPVGNGLRIRLNGTDSLMIGFRDNIGSAPAD
jgi:hypothetical protein